MPVTEDRTVRERTAYVVSRWRFVVAATAAAGLLAFAVSEFQPRRYTATATVIIDPPGTNDPRAAMAVNPTYLDSLRTFERFFTSDTLFQRAAQQFHLDSGKAGITALRNSVLTVAVDHETRVLVVSATLPDPKAAIALVRYITEESIQASRDEATAADRDTLADVTKEFDSARVRFEKARTDWEQAALQGTPEALQGELTAAIELQSEVSRLRVQAEAEAAEWRIRARDGDAQDRQSSTVLADASSARASEYAKREHELEGEISTKRTLLAVLSERHVVASGEFDSSRKAYEAALSRVRDFSALNGLRSEHLRVIDPGVEPRQPSSPKVLLNTIAGSLLAACIAVAWLNFMAGAPRQRPAVVRAPAAYEERSVSAR
jgi:capsular polysaccharide biosynthesis protein